MPAELRRAVPRLSPLQAQLLFNRGLLPNGTDPDALERFLAPRWDTGLYDPFLLQDMERAVERILTAIDRQEPVGVFGHYDADGLTATVLLTEVLSRLGARAIPYIPSRSEEYGVNEAGIVALARQNVRLLVSVDCGIRSFDAPATAAKFGMDVIITDHHTVLRYEGRDVLPEAYAVINPMRADCPYPCKSLSGVGVAFKLAHALLTRYAERHGNGAKPHLAKWLLDLVSIGTIADVVDVTGENRALVSLGLVVLRYAKRPGIRALMGVAGTPPNRVGVDEVGFQLAPRINAAARIGSADTSLQLLFARDSSTAGALAGELERLNRQRQQLVRDALDDIRTRYGDTLAERKAVVVSGPWAPGIIGLIAGRLADEYNRPAVVIETNGGELLQGSARSRPGFHIADALHECRHLLERYGGHAQAAGFSLPAAHLEAFRQRLFALADRDIPEEALEPVLPIDAVLKPDDLTAELVEEVRVLEPFGPGNPPPLFGMRDVRLASVQRVGRDGAHLRLAVRRNERALRAMGWRMGHLADTL
ncbi:MAG: single-stranded-DNA-specific exonuclease RecJ, partial [Armatimonadota bacterium]|nr:single-stranded-DNA-specific exonuclease RecJ [Armatimonadota bacterium]